ncbi:hypothetical protein B0T16DRAFT_423918 [Cercophora newfieldiana]|uniref:Clr5 domain-containing protein n=1 Tax=Cercophora newfieldiana TaxID=92897 RepID=A0AA40CIS2_9PEZI|nr:hypothetical protein B0T16DRAFT_423918 [Cercophora newfieldiana]
MPKAWDDYKEIIIAEYKEHNRPLHEVRRILDERYGFKASTRAYRSRLDIWGVHKYSCRRRNGTSKSEAGDDEDEPMLKVSTLGMPLHPSPYSGYASTHWTLAPPAFPTPAEPYTYNGGIQYSEPVTGNEFGAAQSAKIATVKSGTWNASGSFKGEPAPFTDSGYASEPRLLAPPTYETRIEPTENMDARTEYSGATSVSPVASRAYIAEFCQDVHAKALQYRVDEKDWPQFSQVLSDLIKAFALKVGQTGTPDSLGIMHFVYKNHQNVLTGLRELLLGCDDDADSSYLPNIDSGGMSLSEKLRLWDRMDGLEAEVADSLFEGIEDGDDPVADGTQLQFYSKTIHNSTAYAWFLAHAQKQAAAQHLPAATSQSIRRMILEQLPAGRISKHRPPRTHQVTFRPPISLLVAKDCWHKEEVNRPGKHVVIVENGGVAQMTLMDEYVALTWPFNGPQFLQFLERSMDLDNEGTSASATELPDRTVVEAEADPYGRLSITVSGTAYSIADGGEQLAWLSAVYSRHEWNSTACNIPSLRLLIPSDPTVLSPRGPRGYSASSVNSPKEDVGDKNMEIPGGRVGFEIQVLPDPEGVQSLTACDVNPAWQPLLNLRASPSVVKGFELPSRLETCPGGLELSPGIVLKALGVSEPELRSRGPIPLPSPLAPLLSDGQSCSTFLWHIGMGAELSGLFTPCPRHVGAARDAETGVGSSSVELSVVMSSRHFLCECQENGLSHGHGGFGAQRDGTPSSGPDSKHPTPMAKSKGCDLPGRNSMFRSRQDSFLDTTHIPSSEHTLLSSSESSDKYLDPDMLSIPSGSGTSFENQGPTSNGFRVFKSLLRGLMLLGTPGDRTEAEVQDVNNDCPTDGDTTGSGPNHSHSATSTSGTGPVPSSQRHHGKRKLCPSGDVSGNEDEDDVPCPKKLSLGSKPQGGPMYLACPFWKMDSTTHWECALKQLDTIPHLKQHLGRRHTPKHYCQHCYDQFPSFGALDTHVKARACDPGSPQKLGGMSYDQRDRLAKRLSKGSQRQQWLAIWDILFDEIPHPSSIYICPDNVVDIHRIREFSTQQGTVILAAELRANGLVLRSDVADEQLQQVVRRGLLLMLEHFVGGSLASAAEQPSRYHPNAISSTGGSGSSSGPVSHRGRPDASIADSGLDLASPLPLDAGHSACYAGTEYPAEQPASRRNNPPPFEFSLHDLQNQGGQEDEASAMMDLAADNIDFATMGNLMVTSDEQFGELEEMPDHFGWELQRNMDELIAGISEPSGQGSNADDV